jgi:hypothetical protein
VIEEIATLEGELVEPSLAVRAQQDSKMLKSNSYTKRINGLLNRMRREIFRSINFINPISPLKVAKKL